MGKAAIYFDADTSLAPLAGANILFIGYGNQGRAQALNLRDTFAAASPPLDPAPTIHIANLRDSYATQATADGFTSITDDFSVAAETADVIFLLIPDQVQPKVFNERVAGRLKKGALVVVASGYNVFYEKLKYGKDTDVGMVAPRMIGTSVRSRYESGKGFPCFVSVDQDASGKAKDKILALARGIGATKGGAIESSAREETLMDLFAEQALWPWIIVGFREAYSTLKALGCSDEALVHELWLSKEPAEVFEKCADDGFIDQLHHHSTVSQYGQLSGAGKFDADGKVNIKEFFEFVAKKRILGGEFEAEFSAWETKGKLEEKLGELYAGAHDSEISRGEKNVRERLGLGGKLVNGSS